MVLIKDGLLELQPSMIVGKTAYKTAIVMDMFGGTILTGVIDTAVQHNTVSQLQYEHYFGLSQNKDLINFHSFLT